MKRITRTTVASGVIGQFSQEWAIVRLYDEKYDSECFELFINKEHFATARSIVEALSVLVSQFEE